MVDYKNTPIVAPPGQSLRIYWSTSGKHGSFSGTSNTYSSGDGQILYNKAPYECLDFETDQGVENISAKIYFVDSGIYSLIDEIETTINIDNNENKIVFNVNASWWIWQQFPVSSGTAVQIYSGFRVPYYENAVSYQIEIIDYALFGYDDLGKIGRIYTWTNESQSTPIGPVKKDQEQPGDFGVFFGGSGVTNPSTSYDTAISNHGATTGKAIVTVTLSE